MRRAHNGFSLLELVVALAVTAIGLAVLYRAVSGVVSGAAAGRERNQAAMVAETILNSYESVPAAGFSAQGQWEQVRWSAVAVPRAGAPPEVPLADLRIDLRWIESGREQSLALSTVRPVQRPK